MVEVLELGISDNVDKKDEAVVDDCRSFVGLPPMLNNLDIVSAGCTAVASLPSEMSADVVTG